LFGIAGEEEDEVIIEEQIRESEQQERKP